MKRLYFFTFFDNLKLCLCFFCVFYFVSGTKTKFISMSTGITNHKKRANWISYFTKNYASLFFIVNQSAV